MDLESGVLSKINQRTNTPCYYLHAEYRKIKQINIYNKIDSQIKRKN